MIFPDIIRFSCLFTCLILYIKQCMMVLLVYIANTHDNVAHIHFQFQLMSCIFYCYCLCMKLLFVKDIGRPIMVKEKGL